MRRSLVSRLERLESAPTMGTPQFFRYGWLQPLPADYVGDRHVAIVSREPTTSPLIEWCVFEERPGTGPGVDASDGMTVFLTEPPATEGRLTQ